MVVGLHPVRILIFGNNSAAGPKLRIVVTRIIAKLAPLGVGHLVLADVIRIEINQVDGPLRAVRRLRSYLPFECTGGHENELPEAIVSDRNDGVAASAA